MAIVLAYRTGIRGRRADGVMIEGIVPQGDGGQLQWSSCGAASEAERIISQQKGARPSKGTPWPPTARAIRAATGDYSGGLTPLQTTRASYAKYGITSAAPRIRSAQEVKSKLWAGYSVDALVGYGPIDDWKSGSPGFRGNHRGLLAGIRTTTTGAIQVLWLDPLYDGRRSGIPNGPEWMPWGVMFRALGALKTDGVRTLNQTHGTGMAYFIPSLTRMVPATTNYMARVPAGSYWVYTIVNGRIEGRTAYRTGGFSGSCTAPREYTWEDKNLEFSLVQMTSGVYRGRYISAAKYARKTT